MVRATGTSSGHAAPLSEWIGTRNWRTPFPEADSPLDQAPQLGFSGYLIHGTGEYVVSVDRATPAAQIGLEPGDGILALNACQLACEGVWYQAMARAAATNGTITLKIRDGRTGRIVSRDSHVFCPSFLGRRRAAVAQAPVAAPASQKPSDHVG